jgi:hypothetical protein
VLHIAEDALREIFVSGRRSQQEPDDFRLIHDVLAPFSSLRLQHSASNAIVHDPAASLPRAPWRPPLANDDPGYHIPPPPAF